MEERTDAENDQRGSTRNNQRVPTCNHIIVITTTIIGVLLIILIIGIIIIILFAIIILHTNVIIVILMVISITHTGKISVYLAFEVLLWFFMHFQAFTAGADSSGKRGWITPWVQSLQCSQLCAYDQQQWPTHVLHHRVYVNWIQEP